MRCVMVLFLTILLVSPCLAGDSVYPEMMFILDASGSMWGKAGAETKIEAARRVMKSAVPALSQEVRIGLTAYGHNRKGDCNDIEVLIPVGSADRSVLLAKVDSIKPKGKTPIAGSLAKVTGLLKNKEEETTIVLVSDGEETCDADPCGAVKRLKDAGLNFILHVVGFGVNTEQKKQLSCLAKEGGGNYFGAADGDALLSALTTVSKEIEVKVEKAKATVKKATTKLGKLHVTIPGAGLEALGSLKLVRKKDNKTIRTVKDPGADATYPLLAGEYNLVGGYANSNYKPESEVFLGTWTVKGGEITDVGFGLMEINIADALKEMPAGAVIIENTKNDSKLVTPNNDNPYYLYKPKPLPPGEYTFSVHYKLNYLFSNTPETPVVLAGPVTIESGKTATVTINCGIRLKKAQEPSVTGWELKNSAGKTAVKIGLAFNGNYPLWAVYGVMPGTYQLDVWLDGMNEPLPVGEALEIKAGELLEFDTGL